MSMADPKHELRRAPFFVCKPQKKFRRGLWELLRRKILLPEIRRGWGLPGPSPRSASAWRGEVQI